MLSCPFWYNALISMPNCIFCDLSPETLHHLFTDCPLVIEFWNALKLWMQQIMGLYLELNPFNILFGIIESDFDSFPKNAIIIVAKKVYLDVL